MPVANKVKIKMLVCNVICTKRERAKKKNLKKKICRKKSLANCDDILISSFSIKSPHCNTKMLLCPFTFWEIN